MNVSKQVIKHNLSTIIVFLPFLRKGILSPQSTDIMEGEKLR